MTASAAGGAKVGETVAAIVEAHRSGASSPEETVARPTRASAPTAIPPSSSRCAMKPTRSPKPQALAAKGDTDLPLYGVPVAVKDNIDVAGLPTTAACPAFAYDAGKDATCVARLRRAGAIVIGKTNLDQFATGLVGVRSPYGMPRNLFDPALIPGGSSSRFGDRGRRRPRSARARHRHRRLRPRAGRTEQHRRPQAEPRPRLHRRRRAGLPHARLRIGVRAHGRRRLRGAGGHGRPRSGRSLFAAAPARRAGSGAGGAAHRRADAGPAPVLRRQGVGRRLRGRACATSPSLGAAIVEIDIEPFYETARLLYDGPWVAERYISRALADRIGAGSDASGDPADHPRRRASERGRRVQGVLPARRAAARARPHLPRDRCAGIADGADGLHRRAGARRSDRAQQPARHLHQLRQPARPLRAGRPGIDAGDGTPFGDHAACASRATTRRSPRSAACSMPAPACRSARPARRSLRSRRSPALPAAGEIAIAVVGAHLTGMPLNGELKSFGARFLERTTTTADYRLFLLAGHDAGETRAAAGRRRCRRGHRRRDLGDAGGAIRALCRVDPRRRSRSAR